MDLSFPDLIALLLLATAAAACLGLVILLLGLQRVFAVAPRLNPDAVESPLSTTSLTVVIPAYNEARNIGDCVPTCWRASRPVSPGACWWWMTIPLMPHPAWLRLRPRPARFHRDVSA